MSTPEGFWAAMANPRRAREQIAPTLSVAREPRGFLWDPDAGISGNTANNVNLDSDSDS